MMLTPRHTHINLGRTNCNQGTVGSRNYLENGKEIIVTIIKELGVR